MPTDGFILHTVSIDIVDKELGNLMDPVSQAYWLQAVRCGYVVGLIGGPPCETWSKARGHALAGRRGPRVIRTPACPCGLAGTRELRVDLRINLAPLHGGVLCDDGPGRRPSVASKDAWAPSRQNLPRCSVRTCILFPGISDSIVCGSRRSLRPALAWMAGKNSRRRSLRNISTGLEQGPGMFLC